LVPNVAAEFHRFHGKARPVIGTCLYGLVASLAAVAFQLSINWLYQSFKFPASGGTARFAVITLAIVVVTSLLVGWLLNSFCPEAAGSGIPQVKLRFSPW
jgi:chloride channel protein, CIC family